MRKAISSPAILWFERNSTTCFPQSPCLHGLLCFTTSIINQWFKDGCQKEGPWSGALELVVADTLIFWEGTGTSGFLKPIKSASEVSNRYKKFNNSMVWFGLVYDYGL